MSEHQLPKAYDFKSTEKRIYAVWEAGGFFKPWNDPHKPGFDPSVKPFVISIPPPNVTGELHLGHALTTSVEDLMIRYHRMKGQPDPVGARLGPCRHRHPAADREDAGARRHQPRGAGTRGIPAPHLGVEGKIRRHHHPADPPPGRVLRLGPRTLHAGRRAVQGSARGVRDPLRKGTDLPRPAPDQLVAGTAHRCLGRGGGIQRGRSQAVLLQVHAGG